MDELRRLSLNQATIPSWSLPEAADGCAKAGLGWIGVWRDRLAEVGIAAATRSIRDAGIGVSSLLRGGFFDASESTARRRHMDGNRRAVEEAAALQAKTLVLVCGPAAGRDLEGARAYIAEAIAELRDFAAPCGVALGIEPMHPVYCADRSAVVTLRQALALAAPHPQAEVGVVIDAYHVWWDPDLRAEVAAARGRIQGYHVCDWLVPPPDHLNGRGMMGDGVICPSWTLEEALVKGREYGYRGVELRLVDGELIDDSMPAAERKRVGALIADSGLDLVAVDSSIRLTDGAPDVVAAEIARFLELAAGWRSPLIRVFGGSGERDNAVRALRLAVREAERTGVRIGLETHDEFSSAAAVGGWLHLRPPGRRRGPGARVPRGASNGRLRALGGGGVGKEMAPGNRRTRSSPTAARQILVLPPPRSGGGSGRGPNAARE